MLTLKMTVVLNLLINILIINKTFSQELNLNTIKQNTEISVSGRIIDWYGGGSDGVIDSGKYIIKDGQKKKLIYVITDLSNYTEQLIKSTSHFDELTGQVVSLRAIVIDPNRDFYNSDANKQIVLLKFISWDNNFEKIKIAEKDNHQKELLRVAEEQKKQQLRIEAEKQRADAEAEYQSAQQKMRIEEEKERLRNQRISDLRSGKIKITNIEDAKLALNPSLDNKYTMGLPIDGLTKTGDYYLWSGTLSWKSGNIYYCLDNFMGKTKCFGFTNLIVRFNEMRENSQVAVVGRLAGTSEVTLINKISGFKENKMVPVLTDCYVF